MVIQTQVDEAKASAEAVSAETPLKDKEVDETEAAEAETRHKHKEETEHATKSTKAPGQDACTLPISILATKTVVGLYFRSDIAVAQGFIAASRCRRMSASANTD